MQPLCSTLAPATACSAPQGQWNQLGYRPLFPFNGRLGRRAPHVELPEAGMHSQAPSGRERPQRPALSEWGMDAIGLATSSTCGWRFA